jgi:hypothetical protein
MLMRLCVPSNPAKIAKKGVNRKIDRLAYFSKKDVALANFH